MMRRGVLLSLMLVGSLATGCRCCPLLNPYANAVDDINDSKVYFDKWYNPRWDVSRAGKPDWCGPINSRIGRNICYLGCYDQYDDHNLYPPSNPYTFPGSSLPAPKVWTPGSPVPSPTLPPDPYPDNSSRTHDRTSSTAFH